METALTETMLEASLDGMAVLENGRFLRLNDEFAATFRYEPTALVGKSWRCLYDDTTVERFETDVFPTLEREGAWRGEATGVKQDGRTVSHDVSLRAGDGHTIWVVSGETPSADRRSELERYKTIVTNIRDAVYTLDPMGTITWVNDVAVQEFDGGYDREDLVGSSVSKVLPPDDVQRCITIIHELVTGKRDSAKCEISLVTACGDEIPAELHLTLLPFENGEFQGTIGVVRDITRRKRHEQRLTVLNRVLRHNVRTDMNVIMGHAGFLADDETIGERHQDHVNVIRKTARDLVELGDKARHLAMIDDVGDSRTEPIDVTEVLRRLCDRYEAEHPDLTITRSLPEEAYVLAEAGLEVALSNVLENAVEHNAGETSRVDVTVRNAEDGETTEITFVDDGPGIPEEEIRVLERGEEAPLNHASGLGLWLIDWIVTVSNGDVTFSNQEDCGTEVRLSLSALSSSKTPVTGS